ncbi:MAG: hypothetical protein ABWY47_10505, partial [Xanthobacteraceae bacterium]
QAFFSNDRVWRESLIGAPVWEIESTPHHVSRDQPRITEDILLVRGRLPLADVKKTNSIIDKK